jgi:putative endonuclease
MNYCCYILISRSLNRYYIGHTTDIELRLKYHNNGKFGKKSFTYKTSDWKIYLLIPCETMNQAILLESKIKRMKSRKYIENLKKYPELITKILLECHVSPSR